MRTLSFICHIVATIFVVIAVLLILANETTLAGMNPVEWFIVGSLFHFLGHWVPTPWPVA